MFSFSSISPREFHSFLVVVVAMAVVVVIVVAVEVVVVVVIVVAVEVVVAAMVFPLAVGVASVVALPTGSHCHFDHREMAFAPRYDCVVVFLFRIAVSR